MWNGRIIVECDLFQLLFLSSHSQWVRSLHTLNKYLVSLSLNCLTWIKCFCVAFHKLPTISWVNVGPFLLKELVYLSQVCKASFLAQAFFEFCPHIFYMIEVRALWWPFQYLDLLSLNNFATTLELCLGSLSSWKTHVRQSFNFLTDVLRCCFNTST